MNDSCDPHHSTYFMYENFKIYFLSWFGPFMMSFGVGGNVLILYVLSKISVVNQSVRYWFQAMSVIDILILIVCCMDLYLNIFLPNIQSTILDTLLGHKYQCAILHSILQGFMWSANWLLAMFSLQRTTVVVCHPFKSHFMESGRSPPGGHHRRSHHFRYPQPSNRRTVLIISSVIIFCFMTSAAVNSTTFVSSIDPLSNRTTCSRWLEGFTPLFISRAVYYFELSLFRVLPLIIIFLTSMVTIFHLAYLRPREIHKLKQSGIVLRRHQSHAKTKAEQQHRKSRTEDSEEIHTETRISLILIIMNVIVIVTNHLFIGFEFLDGFFSEGYDYGNLTGDKCISTTLNVLFNFLLYTYSQVNWIFFLLLGKQFRRVLGQCIRTIPTSLKTKVMKMCHCHCLETPFWLTLGDRLHSTRLHNHAIQPAPMVFIREQIITSDRREKTYELVLHPHQTLAISEV